MSDPLTDEDLDRIRHRARPAPEPPCSGCGCEGEWDEHTGMYHRWHSEGCPVAERIRQMYGDPPETEGRG